MDLLIFFTFLRNFDLFLKSRSFFKKVQNISNLCENVDNQNWTFYLKESFFK